MHASICDVLADIVQNSIEAASKTIAVTWRQEEQLLSVTVIDDGKGMDEKQVEKALDPFYTDGVKHAARKVGLGLPFLVQLTESTGGEFSLTSRAGEGTTVSFTVPLSHIDTPPIGDLVSTMTSLFSYPGESEIEFFRSLSAGGRIEEYEISRSSLLEVLGELNTVGNMLLMKEFLQSQETAVEEVHHRVR